MFQATSDRLFGYADVGSDAQEQAESTALDDLALRAAIEAVRSTVDRLAAGLHNDGDAADVAREMEAIGP